MCYGSIFLYFAQPSWSGSELWCVGDVDSGASLSSWLQPPQLWGPGQIMKSSCACDFSSLKVGVIVVLTNGVIRRVQWKAHVNVSREPSSVAGPASFSCWGHRYYCRWNSPSLQPGLWPLPCRAGPASLFLSRLALRPTPPLACSWQESSLLLGCSISWLRNIHRKLNSACLLWARGPFLQIKYCDDQLLLSLHQVQ